MAQTTKSTQTNPARVGLNRDRRGGASSTAAPARAPIPALAGAGGRRGGRGNPIDFIRDVRSELRKVAWPNQRETINLTAVVIAFSVAVGLLLGGIDFLFQELFRFLLGLQSGGGV